MNTLNAIVVDDERSALELLRQKVITLHPDINISGAFQDPREALDYIKERPPDILFLDIEMPRMNGFQLLSELTDLSFQVIFVTAYNEYALKAIKESAVDYVLKPVDDADLIAAVKKARNNIEQQRQVESGEKLVQVLRDTIKRSNKLIVPTSKGMSLIPEAEVLHLEGYEGYTRIHLYNGDEIMSSYSLGKFEKSASDVFFKCHKSHIVNLERVRAFENEGYLVLDNEARVPISRSNRKPFLDLFNEN